jgi:hypothetical protein
MSVNGDKSDSSGKLNKSDLRDALQLLDETRRYHSKRFDVGLGERAVQEVDDFDGDWYERFVEDVEPSAPVEGLDKIRNKK